MRCNKEVRPITSVREARVNHTSLGAVTGFGPALLSNRFQCLHNQDDNASRGPCTPYDAPKDTSGSKPFASTDGALSRGKISNYYAHPHPVLCNSHTYSPVIFTRILRRLAGIQTAPSLSGSTGGPWDVLPHSTTALWRRQACCEPLFAHKGANTHTSAVSCRAE